MLAIIHKQKAIIYKERLKAKDYENHDLLFARPDGKPYDPKYISHTATKYKKEANFPYFTFHVLRHTHATLLLLAGVHFKVIQHRLGHSTYQQTMDIYSHIVPDIEENVIDKLAKLI